jgi:hypothetical protein
LLWPELGVAQRISRMGLEWRFFFPVIETSTSSATNTNQSNNEFDFLSSVVNFPKSSWGAPEQRTDEYYLFSNTTLGKLLTSTVVVRCLHPCMCRFDVWNVQHNHNSCCLRNVCFMHVFVCSAVRFV